MGVVYDHPACRQYAGPGVCRYCHRLPAGRFNLKHRAPKDPQEHCTARRFHYIHDRITGHCHVTVTHAFQADRPDASGTAGADR